MIPFVVAQFIAPDPLATYVERDKRNKLRDYKRGGLPMFHISRPVIYSLFSS